MKRNILLFFLSVAVVFFAGCSSEPKFDASKVEESAEKMVQALPEDKRALLEASFERLFMERAFSNPMIFAAAFSGDENIMKAAAAGVFKDLNGLTADQIIKKAALTSEDVAKWQKDEQVETRSEKTETRNEKAEAAAPKLPSWRIDFSENAIDDSKEVWCRLSATGRGWSSPSIVLSYKNGEFRGYITDVCNYFSSSEKPVILRFGKEKPIEEMWLLGSTARIPNPVAFVEQLAAVERFAFLEKDSGRDPALFEYGNMNDVVTALKEVGAIK